MNPFNNKFWLNYFKNNKSVYYLPELVGNSNDENFKSFVFSVDEDINNNLCVISGNNELKKIIFLYVLFAHLLSKYNADEDLVICFDCDILEGNPLFLKLDYQGSSFKELLNEAKEKLVSALNYSNYNFEELYESLLVNEIDIHEIVKCGFNCGKSKYKESLQFNFSVILDEFKNVKNFQVFYDKTKDVNFVNSFMQSYIYSLQQILSKDIDIKLNDLYPLSNFELVKYKEDQKHSPLLDRNLFEFFEETANLFPERKAIDWKDIVVTYGSLKCNSDLVYNNLVKLYGVGNGDVVGVSLNTSPKLLEIILACLRLGATILLLDKNVTQNRFDYVLKDSNAKYLIQDLSYLSESTFLNQIDLNLLYKKMDLISDNVSRATDITSDSGAFLMYTSGSTGNPNGVVLTHQNLINQFAWFKEYFNFQSSDVFPQKASLNFVDCLTELLFPITLGQSAVYLRPDDNINQNPLQIGTWLDAIRVTILLIVPSVAKRMNESFPFKRLKSLKHLIYSGELLNYHFTDHYEVYNLYGCTECSSISTIYRIDKDSRYQSYPIGKPVDNVTIFIMDKDMNPLPSYAIGELYVKGISVSNGYLNSGLNSEKFVNIYDGKAVKFYKTGDLARLSETGDIIIIGRKDQQVKVRGMRIDLSELENLIITVDGITQAVSVYHNSPYEGVSVYISGKQISREIIDSLIIKNLGKAYIPFRYIYVEDFQVTATGKINKQYYKSKIVHELENQVTLFSAPIDSHEMEMMQIWQKVLSCNQIGREDNFFELGGDSISSARIMYEIYQVYVLELDLNLIFRFPVLKDFTKQVHILLGDIKIFPPSNEVVNKQEMYHPLSAAQRRILFLENFFENENQFSIVSVLKITGKLNIAALSHSLNELRSRHDVLRTNFVNLNFEFWQVLNDNSNFELSIKQLPTDQNIEKIYLSEVNRRFDLEKDSLIRASLYMGLDDQYHLFISFHHIITDYWSSNIFFKELYKIYLSTVSGESYNLSNNVYKYIDYAKSEATVLDSSAISSTKDFWKDLFHDMPCRIALPYDRPYNESVHKHGFVLNKKLIRSAEMRKSNLEKQYGVSEHDILLTIVYCFLSKLCNQYDLVVGDLYFGRTNPRLLELMGCFVNILPVRFNVNGHESLIQNAKRLANLIRIIKEQKNYPYDLIVGEVREHIETDKLELIDVMFNYLPNLNINTENSKYGLNIETFEFHNKKSQYPISFKFQSSDKELSLDLEFNENLFNKDTALSLFNNFNDFFENIMNFKEEKSIDMLTVLPIKGDKISISEKYFPIEEITILDKWNDVSKLFANNNAVKYGDISITFKELDRESSCIANYFIKDKNIAPGDIIGFAGERDLFTVSVILGILKSGGVYMPINTDAAPARTQVILDEVKPKLIYHSNNKVIEEKLYGYNLVSCNDLQLILTECKQTKNLRKSLQEDIAYIMFTSGTSGTPKGVPISHSNLFNKIITLIKEFDFNQYDRSVLLSDLSFDPSIEQIFMSLLSGGQLTIIDNETKSNADKFWDRAYIDKINVINCVPSYIDFLLVTDRYLKNISIKYLLLGGDSLFKKTALNVFDRLDVRYFINMYGPTEATVSSTMYLIEAELLTEFNDKDVLPIGSALPNYKISITDNNLLPLKVGEVGEIVISGIGVASGYFTPDRLINKSFLVDPEKPSQKIYKTGDLGIMDQNGNIKFLGRNDNQIKINGVRIELEDIESAINKVNGIKDNVVKCFKNDFNQYLVAYYISENGLEIGNDFIISELMNFLPSGMIPMFYILISKIPTNSNGKIDKDKLEMPTKAIDRVPYNNSRVNNEIISTKLTNMWARIIGCEIVNIDANSNFFELGGNSLGILALSNEINKEFDLKISVATIFYLPKLIDQLEFINNVFNPVEDQQIIKTATLTKNIIKMKNLKNK